MSYNQKPAGAGNSGMGGAGPPNGPNNTQQVAKTLAGIQQQMQNFVHAQNALPQSSQADFNTLLQQQRFQNIIKQQQQHLLHQHIQQQMQQQQQQHQQQHQHQQQNKDRIGTEPLALTRTPAAVDLLNKTYQQHHQHPNGNPNAANSAALNPFQQQLQVISPNIVQQLQAFQLQMQQHQQQQQQQHQQQQHHSQTQQQVQHHTSSSGPLQSLPQQQLHGQSAQQQKTALTTAAAAVAAAQLQQRYLSAAVSAQTAAAQATSGSKIGATPPPLTTNQIKPPTLPPSTQITPVPANTGSSQSIAKTSANTPVTAAATNSSAKQITPSISLLPSKPSGTTATPVAAHQQIKQNINKNSTPATIAVATPTPAHVQKPTTSSVPSSQGNTLLASSSEFSAKPNLNSNTSVPAAATKIPQKSVVTQAAKNVSPPTPLSTNIATAAAKLQSPLGSGPTKQTTTNFHSQLPPPKSLQAVVKPASGRVDNTAQNNSESLNQATVPKPLSVSESKIPTSTLNEAGKTNNSVTVDKPEVTKENTNTVTENPTKNTVPKPPDQSKTTSNEKPVKAADIVETSEKTKNDHDSEKANNNNVAEKNKSADKKETQEDITNSKVHEANKKPTKESSEVKIEVKNDVKSEVKNEVKNEGKAKNIVKSADTPPIESSTRSEVVQKTDSTTSQSTNSVSDKKIQDPTDSKKATEESDREIQNKSVENKVEENKEQKSNSKKDTDAPKEKDVKVAKIEKTDSKQDPTTTSSDSVAATSSPSHAKVKAPKETEAAVSSETTLLKNPIRHAKPSKTAATGVPVAPSTSVAVEKSPEVVEKSEKTEKTEKIEKSEKIEKAPINRISREEKRKTPKISDDTTTPITPSTPKTPRETNNTSNDRKSQRHRLKTILYQSPLPELAYITKLSASEASNSPKPMAGAEDKLIVFYKSEYMAVRNAEGTFYLCQTMQNVYRTSPRISIRWLSEDPKDSSVYIPDFYDHTDIECVLTTVELKRIDKGHLRLPETEKARIENILKKAIDVEKGLVPRPELTEENPDGLDISLYKDESQIEKKLSGSQTPVSTVRNNRRSVSAGSSKSNSKTNTPSKAANKRKTSASGGGGSPAKKSKSSAKKRKPSTKRKSRRGTTSDEENETSEDHASDAEYKPNQKKSVNATQKSTPRTQRSPLAKARVASPVASTSASAGVKNVSSSKVTTPSTPTQSRNERANKRKAGVDTVADCSPVSTAKKAAASNVSNPESTTIIQASKSSITKSKESVNNDATAIKKLTAETSSTVSSSDSVSNTVDQENENATTTANGSSSHSNSSASRPTRSRK